MNNILLTDEDVEKFKLFLEHYDTFSILVDSGALNQRSSSVVLCYDHDGILQLIRREDILFSKKFAKEKKSDILITVK